MKKLLGVCPTPYRQRRRHGVGASVVGTATVDVDSELEAAWVCRQL